MRFAQGSWKPLSQSAVTPDLDQTPQFGHWHDAAAMARLQAQVEAQATLIREQAAALAHSRKIFDRASAAARIGVWECTLADASLTWTDQVYEMFDIARDASLNREELLKLYTPASLKQLEEVRSRALAEHSGFHLDAEIVTPKGNRRWIRLTATVECEDGVPVRIFGMKQDITEEKILSDRMRYLAEFDVMTGLANRSSFQARLAALGPEVGTGGRPAGALALVDLDGFKQINDLFGHALGDECLKEAAQRLSTACHGAADLVARIGGDEFAVLLRGSLDQTGIETIARRIVDTLGRPMRRKDGLLRVGASVGIATIDGGLKPSELFTRADAALYAAKAAGRNTFCLFSPAMMDLNQVSLPAAGTPSRPDRRRFRGSAVA
ncbi:diguanylate cyclase [Roseiarcaceae bacterium H3SJ34-1]|uniref:diguanylate cyclase domain-containing protein n=1 Tax=Terripilifer ovatus TaxID=3032367 RepID=UPI003AB93C25|nr:diguanylate cyclase [Roseiarcaceae bacterium H3SJ34-1]